MNVAREAITVTKMRTVPTLLGLTAVVAKKGSLETGVYVQVELKWTRLTKLREFHELE